MTVHKLGLNKILFSFGIKTFLAGLNQVNALRYLTESILLNTTTLIPTIFTLVFSNGSTLTRVKDKARTWCSQTLLIPSIARF